MKKIKLYGKEEIIYEPQEIEFVLSQFNRAAIQEDYCKQVYGGRKKKKFYTETLLTFDIETYTIIPNEFLENPEKTEKRPYAYAYTMQLWLGGYVILCRYWKELLDVMKKIANYFYLDEHYRMVCYVHNLSYEMQFMKSFFEISELFAKDVRKPLRFFSMGFEFRCAYFLSNMSLEKFCENSTKCVHPKLSGEDFNYYIRRTPETELSEKELGYIYCDVAGLAECILQLRESENDTWDSIPLTSTGYVRRDCRKSVKSNHRNWYAFQTSRLSLKQYDLMQEIFRGGDTHASRFFSGMRIKNVRSYDIKSSYPYVMMTDYFPIGKMMEWNFYVGGKEEFAYLCRNYCVMFSIQLYNLRLKAEKCDPYLDTGHTTKRCQVRGDNGRILAASMIEIPMTEIDWKIVQEEYDFDEYIITECYYCKRGKISQEIKNTIWKYFSLKCQLDGVKGKEYEYARAKNKLNAIFGMMVASLIHDDIIINNEGKWKIIKKENREEELDKYYNNRNNFLSYQQGVYVTAHARAHLYSMRRITSNDTIYWDTDSLKFINSKKYIKFFNDYNKEVVKYGLKQIAAGKEVYLGVYEDEGEYEEFKTFGAKKYAFVKNGKFQITVAGMSKQYGKNAIEKLAKENNISVMDAFELGQTYDHVGRTVSFYHDELERKKLIVDDCEIETGSNVGLIETTYTLGLTNEYYELIFEKNYGLRTRNQEKVYRTSNPLFPWLDLTEVWNYGH